MRVIDIISRVRVSAGDISALQFDNAALITWINDGVRECALENFLLQKRATTTLTVGTAEYALPTDIMKLYTIVVDKTRLDIYTLQQYQTQNFDAAESGRPMMAYVWAGKYTLWPTPDQAYSVEVDYIKDPDDIPVVTDTSSDAIIPAIPTTYHGRLVDYCLAQVALQDDNQEMYAVKLEEFKTGVKRLADQTEQEEALYPTISISPRDMGDGSFDWLEYY